MRYLVLAFALTLTGASVAHGQAAQIDPLASRTVLAPRADSPVEIRNLTYRSADGEMLALDLYFDPTRQGPRPVLLLNGGTGDARDWGGFKDFAKLAAERGFAAINAVKRFPRGGEGIQTGRADTLTLVEQLGTLAPDVIDADQVCLWAFSGGGTTMSIAYAGHGPKLSCVIGYYPAVSLTPFAPDNAAWLAVYSPAHAAAARGGPDSPPTLIVRAGKDSAQLNGMIAEFTAAAIERNLPLILVNIPAAVHGFDWFDDTDWARQAIEESFNFARKHTRVQAGREPALVIEN